LERRLDRLNETTAEVADAVARIPQTDFRLDEKGFTKRQKQFFGKENKREQRRK
jgi:hypothetical protein